MQDFTSENAPEATAEQIGEPVLQKRPGRPKKEKTESAAPLKRGRKPKAAKAVKRGKKTAAKRGRRSAKDKLLGIKDASAVRKGKKPATVKAPKKTGRKPARKAYKAVAAPSAHARSVFITLSPELGYYLSRQADRYDMDIAGYVKHLIIKDMPANTRE